MQVVIFTQVELGVEGLLRQVWEVSEEAGNELGGETLLVRPTLDGTQDGCILLDMLATETHHNNKTIGDGRPFPDPPSFAIFISPPLMSLRVVFIITYV